jgi:hypothetical protein
LEERVPRQRAIAKVDGQLVGARRKLLGDGTVGNARAINHVMVALKK